MSLEETFGRIVGSMRRRRGRAAPQEPSPAWPPGHFYSPIPSLDEVRWREGVIFGPAPRAIPGVDLNEPGQFACFEAMAPFYAEQPFGPQPQAGLRFYFDNPNFSCGEGIILYCLVRHARPLRIVEIGSGYSSAAILDVNERHFGNAIACTFVEPYPELLDSLLAPGDRERIEIIRRPVQEVGREPLEALGSGDVLMVDSTHVLKTGSDVNYILFEILPGLAPGVYVHFHDVYYPFEYPREWVYAGRAWNEVYALRAFLQYNTVFEIVYFNSFFATFHRERLRAAMPLCAMHPGSSLWLRKR
jgi:Methyltransferase domain